MEDHEVRITRVEDKVTASQEKYTTWSGRRWALMAALFISLFAAAIRPYFM
jgi:hypothetical protein